MAKHLTGKTKKGYLHVWQTLLYHPAFKKDVEEIRGRWRIQVACFRSKPGVAAPDWKRLWESALFQEQSEEQVGKAMESADTDWPTGVSPMLREKRNEWHDEIADLVVRYGLPTKLGSLLEQYLVTGDESVSSETDAWKAFKVYRLDEYTEHGTFDFEFDHKYRDCEPWNTPLVIIEVFSDMSQEEFTKLLNQVRNKLKATRFKAAQTRRLPSKVDYRAVVEMSALKAADPEIKTDANLVTRLSGGKVSRTETVRRKAENFKKKRQRAKKNLRRMFPGDTFKK